MFCHQTFSQMFPLILESYIDSSIDWIDHTPGHISMQRRHLRWSRERVFHDISTAGSVEKSGDGHQGWWRATNNVARLEGGRRRLPVGEIDLRVDSSAFPWALERFERFLVAGDPPVVARPPRARLSAVIGTIVHLCRAAGRDGARYAGGNGLSP